MSRVCQKLPLPKDLWIQILIKYLDSHALHHLYDTSWSMREFFRQNQIWRKCVLQTDYWDHCGLTDDPYRLLLAFSAIGKEVLNMPWSNDTRAEMLVDTEVNEFGIPNIYNDTVNLFDKKGKRSKRIKPTNIVETTYHLLGMGYTRIVYFLQPSLQCAECESCVFPCFCE